MGWRGEYKSPNIFLSRYTLGLRPPPDFKQWAGCREDIIAQYYCYEYVRVDMQITMDRSERSLLTLGWGFHSLNRRDNIKPLYGMYQRESLLCSCFCEQKDVLWGSDTPQFIGKTWTKAIGVQCPGRLGISWPKPFVIINKRVDLSPERDHNVARVFLYVMGFTERPSLLAAEVCFLNALMTIPWVVLIVAFELLLLNFLLLVPSFSRPSV